MTLSIKLLISLCIVALFSTLGFIVYKQIEMSNRQIAIETQVIKQKELVDGIVRSQSEFSTKKDIELFIKDQGLNLKAIKDDLAKFNADIKLANKVTVTSDGGKKTNQNGSTGPANPDYKPPTAICDGKEIPCPNADPYGYNKAPQRYDLNEKFGKLSVPFGTAIFEPWKQSPWSEEILPREYNVVSVIGYDQNQRSIVYNKFTLKVNGQEYALDINSAKTEEVYPESQFYFWNPRLFLGLDGGINTNQIMAEIAPSVDISLMSYGRFKNMSDFTFIQLGVGYGSVSNKVNMIFTPISYNIKNLILILNNTYIAPSIHVNSIGDFQIMAGVRVGL